jgi:hypothetical protein
MNPNPKILAALAYLPTGLESILKVAALPTTSISTTIVYVLTAADGTKAAGTMWKRVAGAWIQQTAIPVDADDYEGDATTYITFFTYSDRPTMHGSGYAQRKTAVGQIDIWTTGNPRPVIVAVETRLREAKIKSPGNVPCASFDKENGVAWRHGYVEFSMSEAVNLEVADGYGS